jgi:hypothetical protein
VKGFSGAGSCGTAGEFQGPTFVETRRARFRILHPRILNPAYRTANPRFADTGPETAAQISLER